MLVRLIAVKGQCDRSRLRQQSSGTGRPVQCVFRSRQPARDCGTGESSQLQPAVTATPSGHPSLTDCTPHQLPFAQLTHEGAMPPGHSPEPRGKHRRDRRRTPARP